MQKVFRTISFAVLCIVSMLYLPWWATVVCFVLAIFLSPGMLVFLILAAIYDTAFSRNPGFHIHGLVLFSITCGAAVVRYLVMRYTRLAIYDETKSQKNRGF